MDSDNNFEYLKNSIKNGQLWLNLHGDIEPEHKEEFENLLSKIVCNEIYTRI